MDWSRERHGNNKRFRFLVTAVVSSFGAGAIGAWQHGVLVVTASSIALAVFLFALWLNRQAAMTISVGLLMETQGRGLDDKVASHIAAVIWANRITPTASPPRPRRG